QEVGDGSGGSQGFSIRASPKTTPRSPIGGLQIRYDSSGSLPGPGPGLLGAGGGGCGETLPPVATSIEQLLERQWNEGQSFLLQQGAQGDGEWTQTFASSNSIHRCGFCWCLSVICLS
ncbi:hypothetical protein GOODEAATRI_001753, partial [Goodea atripinnis]